MMLNALGTFGILISLAALRSALFLSGDLLFYVSLQIQDQQDGDGVSVHLSYSHSSRSLDLFNQSNE